MERQAQLQLQVKNFIFKCWYWIPKEGNHLQVEDKPRTSKKITAKHYTMPNIRDTEGYRMELN